MKSEAPCVLTINGGSSSIRFAVYETEPRHAILEGKIERIGLKGSTFTANDRSGKKHIRRSVRGGGHRSAVDFLLDWLAAQPLFPSIRAVGHRVVHGMN